MAFTCRPLPLLISAVLAPVFVTAETNPAADVVLNGTVQHVVRHSVDGRVEIHLIVFAGDREVEVHLAPVYFLAWYQFQLYAGDKVEIIATKAKVEPHYLARTVKCGSRTLVLRDERGIPLWKRGRK